MPEVDWYEVLFILDILVHYILLYWLIGLVDRVLANRPGDLGSIPGRVIPKTLKMVLDSSFLILSNIRYVSMVKWSNPGKGVVHSPNLSVVAIENGAFWSPSTTVSNFFLHTTKGAIARAMKSIWLENNLLLPVKYLHLIKRIHFSTQ